MIDDDGIMMSLMIIHVDVEDNVADDLDGVVMEMMIVMIMALKI